MVFEAHGMSFPCTELLLLLLLLLLLCQGKNSFPFYDTFKKFF